MLKRNTATSISLGEDSKGLPTLVDAYVLEVKGSYALVYWPTNWLTPFVVAWHPELLDIPNHTEYAHRISWDQGHYYGDLASALEDFRLNTKGGR